MKRAQLTDIRGISRHLNETVQSSCVLIDNDCCFHIAGISFLPYHGAAYAAQVLDSSSVATQALVPGVAYSAVTTQIPVQALPYAQPVTSGCAVTDHSLGNKNAVVPAASSVPVLSAVVNQAVNNAQSMPSVKPPLQSINLTDLLDYSFLMEHGMAETAGSVDLRNPTVLANMLQSLNASTQATDTRQQFSVSKPPAVQSEQAFQQTATVDQQQAVMALSNQQSLAAGQQLYAGYASSTAAVFQQKDAVNAGGVLWPWSESVLSADKSQGVSVVSSVAMPVSSVSYEAVSPPSASADNMSTFSLLDNLQLTADGGYQLAANFLGSTVETSTLFAAATPYTAYSLASASSQQSRTDTTWNGAALSAYSAAATSARLQGPGIELSERSMLTGPLDTAAGRQSAVTELDKMQSRQKSNLGIVLPMLHTSATDDRTSNSTSQTASLCRTTSSVSADVHRMSVLSSDAPVQPALEYLTANSLQSSADKLGAGSVADTATGGIVLTNITGNVYVNQYTMMPGGGTQPLDNALLHATDLATGGSLSCETAVDESACSLNAAPSVAVLLKNTDDELNAFAVGQPLTSSTAGLQPQCRNNLPATRKSPAAAAPESSFFDAEAAPVLAAKPSNKFESCFLQFICGHKAETLSSVLNSPIKTRPVLPKYVPEPRRLRAAEVTVDSVDETTELVSVEPSPVVTTDTVTTAPLTTAELASVVNVSNSSYLCEERALVHCVLVFVVTLMMLLLNFQ